LPADAEVNILTQANAQIQHLYVLTVIMGDTGVGPPAGTSGLGCINHSPAIISLNTNTPIPLVTTPSLGSGTGITVRTEMVTIEVEFNSSLPVGSGIVGAYVDIERF